MYSLYLLRCSDKSLYCGIAQDLSKRLLAHNTSPRGAKYTRSRRPVTLVFSQKFHTKSAALKAEARVKKLSRAEKLAMVAGQKKGKGRV